MIIKKVHLSIYVLMLTFFEKSIKEQKIKDKLKNLTSEAFKLNVFGAPTFLVNNKLFWGQDRLEYAIDESKN